MPKTIMDSGPWRAIFPGQSVNNESERQCCEKYEVPPFPPLWSPWGKEVASESFGEGCCWFLRVFLELWHDCDPLPLLWYCRDVTRVFFQSEAFFSKWNMVTTIKQFVFSDKYYIILGSAYVKKESISNRWKGNCFCSKKTICCSCGVKKESSQDLNVLIT